MPRRSRKKKLRKNQLPPKTDILKDKPLKKHNLIIQTINATSPERKRQLSPHAEMGYWQKKQELKK